MKFSSREELSSFIRNEVTQAVKSSIPSSPPYVTTGPFGRDSAGYSYSRAAALAAGMIDPSQAKEEVRTSERLRAIYPRLDPRSVLVPTGASLLPDSALAAEIGEMTRATAEKYDPDEARWVHGKAAGYDKKALSVGSYTGGGSLLEGKKPHEFIDVQRNWEVFAQAGASEVALGADGVLTVPRLSTSSTAYWAAEGSPISESQPITGSLVLQAKKLGVLVRLNNEMLRMGGPSVDFIVKYDMAKTAAIEADLAMLQGSGGTQIRGLITYAGLISHTASTLGSNGDTFQPQDVAAMEAKLPDAVEAPTAWVMRRTLFASLMNRRADAVSTNDSRGPFLLRGNSWPSLYGTPVVRSAQVSVSRMKGAGSNLTYILLGYFPDWIVARLGVMELVSSGQGDTAMTNDMTYLRGIQHIDAGPRYPSSFVLCDQLLQQ